MSINDINLFELYDDINGMKERGLVDQIEKMKEVVVGSQVKDLCFNFYTFNFIFYTCLYFSFFGLLRG